MSPHPYHNLPAHSYWRTGVSNYNPLEVSGLWAAKNPLSIEDRVMTFGSCFAQHLSKALIQNGFSWLDAEPGPPSASKELQRKYNYGIFSARTGNIYTTKLLRQWMEWAIDDQAPPAEVWEQDGRYYDPFRPAIEPNGFSSVDELHASRRVTLDALKSGLEKCSTFVFTLGLTEAWENRANGYTYATCPGTNAGEYDKDAHMFRNYNYNEVKSELAMAIDVVRDFNPDLRFLLTVSPVPLTATASDKHVIVSTTYSKSVLRSVAGSLADEHAYIDYFPSYEIISAPCFRGMFFDPNMRSVSSRGVEFVMEHFINAQKKSRSFSGQYQTASLDPAVTAGDTEHDRNLVCEEEILESFSKNNQVD